jgi:anti-sigma factor RsiW
MTGRDDFTDELLSAYLDGEVSSKEREQIAQRLAGSAEYRSELEALRALQAALQDLPRYRLPAEVHQRIMREIERLAAEEVVSSPQSPAFDDELLSAYFDDEVSDEERQVAEQALASNARCRSRLAQLGELDADLRQLTEFHLGDDFAAQVRQRIETEVASVQRLDLESAERVQPAARREAATSRTSWRSFAWTAIAVAAAVILMVNLRSVPEKGQPKIDLTQSPPAGASPWMLVDRRLRDRFVMVCEVNVTPDGVKQGAFFRVWRQHGIRVVDTVPVPERDQRSLLACPFTRSVDRVSTDTPPDVDHVQVFLVYCGARQAEAMFQDFLGRPPGIGLCSLSFTRRSIGDGVLSRLSSVSGVRQKVGQAVHLTANFAIPSSNGTFGTVSYIDPDLLSPPEQPGAKDLQRAEEAVGDPNAVLIPDDFPVEVMFLVRNLRPSERDERPRAVSLAK